MLVLDAEFCLALLSRFEVFSLEFFLLAIFQVVLGFALLVLG